MRGTSPHEVDYVQLKLIAKIEVDVIFGIIFREVPKFM